MKLYEIDFEPVCPVGGTLIILAENEEEALKIAKETVKHEQEEPLRILGTIPLTKGVIVYEDGDY